MPELLYILKPYLKVKVTDIYAKLEELGIGEKNLESGKVFCLVRIVRKERFLHQQSDS